LILSYIDIAAEPKENLRPTGSHRTELLIDAPLMRTVTPLYPVDPLAFHMNADPRHATIDVSPTTAITPQTWNEIWGLTQSFYDTERPYAEGKLREHQRTALFRARGDRALVGMASLDVYPVVFQDRRLLVIYTSHVLIREHHRGQNLIQRLGLQTFLGARVRYPFRPIYWFFDTFSYKSYLLLPRNFRDFWPRYDRQTPEWEQALMNHLAGQTYGSAWRPEQGVVARSGRKRLRPDTAPLQEKHARVPELEFFARANPGHADGDMLVCLCPLSAANWLSVGVRALQRARRGGPSFEEAAHA
jgi:hypothetical protein